VDGAEREPFDGSPAVPENPGQAARRTTASGAYGLTTSSRGKLVNSSGAPSAVTRQVSLSS